MWFSLLLLFVTPKKMPPPPPPPPGPPPAPAFSPANFKTSDNPEKGRNMLLESIRQGKALKKTTVVNDRSAPIVDSKLSLTFCVRLLTINVNI